MYALLDLLDKCLKLCINTTKEPEYINILGFLYHISPMKKVSNWSQTTVHPDTNPDLSGCSNFFQSSTFHLTLAHLEAILL